MIDYTEVRSVIEAALVDVLGLYTYPGDLTTPAIWLDDGTETRAEAIVTGLECVIQPSLEVPISMVLGGFNQTFTGRITLKQWDISQTTLEAMPLLLDALNSELPELLIAGATRIVRSAKIDNIEAFRVDISQTFGMF